MPRDTSAYVVDGERWPSVTEILELAGLTDFDHVPARVLERARERGADFHEWREAIDLGLIDDDMVPPQAIAPRIEAYRRFKTETGFVVEESEKVVRNRVLRYCGTYDIVGRLPDGSRWVVDTKATAAIAPATRIQLAGYALTFDPRPRRAALWLRSDGTYRWLPYKDRSDEHDFVAACRVAHFRLAHGLAKIKED